MPEAALGLVFLLWGPFLGLGASFAWSFSTFLPVQSCSPSVFCFYLTFFASFRSLRWHCRLRTNANWTHHGRCPLTLDLVYTYPYQSIDIYALRLGHEFFCLGNYWGWSYRFREGCLQLGSQGPWCCSHCRAGRRGRDHPFTRPCGEVLHVEWLRRHRANPTRSLGLRTVNRWRTRALLESNGIQQ